MIDLFLIAQLHNPCQGISSSPMTMAKVCEKTIKYNKNGTMTYRMTTTANPYEPFTVNRCTFYASVVGREYQYKPESKWCD